MAWVRLETGWVEIGQPNVYENIERDYSSYVALECIWSQNILEMHIPRKPIKTKIKVNEDKLHSQPLFYSFT